MNIGPNPLLFHPPVAPSNPTESDSSLVDSKLAETHEPSPVRKRRGVADTRYLWPQHSTVKISLLGMSDHQKEVTKTNIKKWQPYINLKLQFVETNDGDIRIAKNAGGIGSSWIGTTAKNEDPDDHTMTVSFVNGDREAGRLIQHEFGHALGLKHEHQHPNNPIGYKSSATEAAFGATFSQREFFTKHPASNTTKLTPYDSRAIMHYYLPPDFTVDQKTNQQNYELSRGDKHLAQTLYPTGRNRIFLIRERKEEASDSE